MSHSTILIPRRADRQQLRKSPKTHFPSLRKVSIMGRPYIIFTVAFATVPMVMVWATLPETMGLIRLHLLIYWPIVLSTPLLVYIYIPLYTERMLWGLMQTS